MSASSRKFAVRLSAMGDVALITGVLDYWRQSRGWRFGVITRKSLAPLFTHHPAVDEVVGLTDAELHFPASLGVFRRLASVNAGCDLIDLHDSLRTRMLAGLWKGRVLRYPKLGLARRLFLLSGRRLCEACLLEHNVPQRYAMAVESPPPASDRLIPHIYLDDEELVQAGLLIEKAGFNVHCMGGQPRAPLLALHPYATHQQKAWPAEYWLRLSAELDRRKINWFILGRESNAAARLTLAAGNAGRDYTNKTDLRMTCALLACADLLISSDSGPMHLATAVGTPVLGLFGPTTRHWGFFPSGAGDQVLEADCPGRPFSLHGKSSGSRGENCMRMISPDAVLKKALQMLAHA
ncbi:MAG: glycosyltransferase family 9 protein [Desulfovibrionaceae bacterium]|nr:glycosyltransferase family 9 protein [Desulfovibrionaceae bacterium]